MALTDAWLKATNGKPREKVLVKSDRDGMSARVSAKGKIVFQLRYRFANKARRMDLGVYPGMTLKQARAEAARYRSELEQGNDPATVKKLERVTKEEAIAFKDLARQWYEKVCVAQYASHEQIWRSFELHVLDELGDLPADEISLNTWMSALERINASYPHIASRVLTNTKYIYRWAGRRELVRTHPLEHIQAKADLNIKKEQGHRALSDDELWLLWRASTRSRMARKNQLFLMLCLAFGCRNGELRNAEKKHFDFERGTWTVPWQNHKTGKKTRKPIIRPIIAGVDDLIREAMSLSQSARYLFSHISKDEPVKHTAYISLPYGVRQWVRKHHEIEMEHWAVHDLRRTARTNFSRLTEPHIAEIMLGHKLPGVWEVYDKYGYIDEQRSAYEAWWDRLMLITQQPSHEAAANC